MACDLSIAELNHGSKKCTTPVQPFVDTIATMVGKYWDRLHPEMEARQWGIQRMADSIGVSFQAIAKVRDGGALGTLNNIKAAKVLGLNPNWLATGEGKKYDLESPTAIPPPDHAIRTTSPPPSTMQPILAWEHPDDLPEGEFVLIPRLGIHLSAGNGCEQVEIEFIEKQPQAFRADWIRKKRLSPKKLASMTADGDSMEERIQHGDALVVDTSQTEVLDGKVYALWYDGGERVKRLYRLPGGGLRIASDNDRHPTIEVPPTAVEHVRIIGRVVHVSGEGGL